jgi:cupin 2 domain-containing protein
MKPENLFSGIPDHLPDELFTTLLQVEGLRIERIVSQGHVSPPKFWCDQEEHEWVVLLTGSAAIEFESEPDPVELKPGTCLNIPAHKKHRVVCTNPTEKTVWLAIYYRNQ